MAVVISFEASDLWNDFGSVYFKKMEVDASDNTIEDFEAFVPNVGGHFPFS